MNISIILTSGITAAVFSTALNYWMQHGQEKRKIKRERYQVKLDYFLGQIDALNDCHREMKKEDLDDMLKSYYLHYCKSCFTFLSRVIDKSYMLTIDQYKVIERVIESEHLYSRLHDIYVDNYFESEEVAENEYLFIRDQMDKLHDVFLENARLYQKKLDIHKI